MSDQAPACTCVECPAHRPVFAAIPQDLPHGQRRVLECYRAYHLAHARPPTIREVAAQLDIQLNAVSQHLVRLAAKGLARNDYGWRGWRAV